MSAAPISISGGEYSVNGAAFKTAPDTVSNRDRVQLRATASSTPGAGVNVALNVGGSVSHFNLFTYQRG